jgi:hypothetical protein
MWWRIVKTALRDKPEIGLAASSAAIGLILAVINIFGASIFGVNDTKIVLALTLATLGSLSWNIFRNQLADQSRDESISRIAELVTGTSVGVRNLAGPVSQVAEVVRDTSMVVRNLSEPTIFDRQKTPYDQLIHHINENGVEKAVFIQYSGRRSEDVLQAVLRTPGATATVYLQDERIAAKIGSRRQAARITGSLRDTLSDWHRNYRGLSELKVYKCMLPMSVRAIMIDDQLLCMGWYTYEPDDRKDAEEFRDDTVAVSGDDIATIIARRGTHEFDALNSTFAMLISKYERYSKEPWLRSAFT